ncbi:MAG: hypothetical protein DCC65_15230 [Planctomycetota bacterium]|nr:MAG: hypothetical protein DCC65_15230 [Planctomycetota bacterium]
MKSLKANAKTVVARTIVCMAALTLVAGTGCDLDGGSGMFGIDSLMSDAFQYGGFNTSYGSGGGNFIGGWEDYSNGNITDSFGLSTGSDIGESLDNYFASNW